MADKMRWRWGDTNPIEASVLWDTVIEIGDLVFDNELEVRPANLHVGLYRIFALDFLGVAMQRSRRGDTDDIRIARTGVFEFDCKRGTFENNELVRPVKTSADGTFLNQTVCGAEHEQYGIGTVAKRVPKPATSVLVQIGRQESLSAAEAVGHEEATE